MTKKVTITDVAQRLGVSVCTVNKAMAGKAKISEKTRQRVIEEARRMGYRPNRMAQVLARRPIRLAYLYPAHFDSFFRPFAAGVRMSVASLADQHVSVCVRPLDPSNWGKAVLAAVRTLLKSGLSGLILSPMAGVDYQPLWNVLADHRVPLVQLGLEVPNSPAAVTVRQDTLLSGRLAAELLSHFGGPAAVMIGNRRVVDHDEKLRGFEVEAGRRDLEIAAVCQHDDDPDMAYSLTSRLLQEHPDVHGIYVATDNFGGIVRALAEQRTVGRIKVVATGLFPEIRAAMEADLVHFALDQRMAEQAKAAVHEMHEILSLRTVEISRILVPPRIAVGGNIGLLAAEGTAAGSPCEED